MLIETYICYYSS